MLQTDPKNLKENVAIGIQQRIANFHIKLEEVLKDNKKLMDAKKPESNDRYIQTETWSMERYLEEIESLKRRKWITDKENKEMKDVIQDYKDRVKKLKEDNRRFLKKMSEMRDKERY